MRLSACFALLACSAALAALAVPALGQNAKETEKERARALDEAEAKAKEKAARKEVREAEEPKTGARTLRLYEWGVETLRFDGGPEPEFDAEIPAAYYEPSEVSVGGERPIKDPEVKPQPDPKPPEPPKRRKPVVYFDCGEDVTFDLDVRFTKGKVTWMYPKPSRMTDAATAQWDNIMLFSDSVTARDHVPAMPDMLKHKADHWAAFSRDGSTSNLLVNGEAERFVFYEGDNAALPEADIFKNADGKIVIRNYSAHALRSVRFTQTSGDGKSTQGWLIDSVPAASGDNPGEAIVGGEDISFSVFSGKGTLTDETKAAGLTEKQAQVFERAWQDVFFKREACTLSYRREAKALDEMMELKVTLPEGFGFEQKRVGYVYIHGIDFTTQAQAEKLAASAPANAEDAAKLKKLGMAGVGALRRRMVDEKLPLEERIAAAKLLAEMGK